MSQMNPYMTNPNAELYAMLGQRAANLDRQGPSVSAGSGIEFDLMSHQAALEELAANRGEGRYARRAAIDRISRRNELEDMLKFQGQSGEQEAALNKAMMEDIARMKMDLQLQEEELNLKLSQAEDANDESILANRQSLRQKMAEINRQEMAAQALMAQKNQQFGKEFSTRVGEVRSLQTALQEYRKGIDGANIDAFIQEFKTNPAKGGLKNLSAAERAGVGIGGMFEGFAELFTGDVTSDTEIVSRLGLPAGTFLMQGGDQGLSGSTMGMIAAAARLKDGGGLKAQLSRSSIAGLKPTTQVNEVFDRLSGSQYQIDADRFTSQLLGDVITKGLSSAGTDFDLNTGNKQVQKLLAQMSSLSRTPNLSAKDMSEQLMPTLKNAATAIFGPGQTEDANLGRMVEALDTLLSKANRQSATYLASMAEGGAITSASIQNAAVAHSLKEAARLKRVLETATSGKVLTSEALASALGEAERVYDPATGTYNIGLLPSGMTEQGKRIAAALGGRTMTSIDEMTNELTRNREALAQLAAQRTGAQTGAESELEQLLTTGKRKARAEKAAVLAAERAKRAPAPKKPK
jgi:hypothetical protein